MTNIFSKTWADAADLIETYGWAKGTFGSQACGFCVGGAFMEACPEFAKKTIGFYGPTSEVNEAVDSVLIKYDLRGKPGEMSVVYINDNLLKTKEEAVKLCRELAEVTKDIELKDIEL